jgi:hypothetical protein
VHADRDSAGSDVPREGAVSESSQQRPPLERYGPLALERHRKDDGRALLLYERVEEPSA